MSGYPTPTITIEEGGDIAQFESGIFSFTPTATGPYDFTFKAENSVGSVETTLSISVNAPAASIEVGETAINVAADETTSYIIVPVTYHNFTTINPYVQFFDADENPLTSNPNTWMSAGTSDNDMYYQIKEENTSSEARTAYFKVVATDDDSNFVYSDLITVTQAGVVAPVPTEINLTKTLVFDTSCGLASGSYAANDDLTELSGVFDGESTPTTFDGFTIKDAYINSSSIQLKKTTGVITFPTIVSEYGFDVDISYQTNTTSITIDGTETTGTDATSATLVIGNSSTYCQIISITLTPRTAPLPDPELSFGATTEFSVAPGADFTAPTLTAASGFDGTVVYSSSDENIAIVDETTGEVLIGDEEGTVTITATSEATSNFKAGSASYTINVVDNREVPIFEFAETSITKNIGDADFTNPLNCPANITVNYTSSNENVAIVLDGVVTIGDPGTTTITATFDGNDTYKPATASYTLKVIDPAHPEEEIYPVVFYESFDNFTGRGGNKDADGDTEWNGITGSTDLTSSSDYDNAGWEPTKGYEAYQCVRFGTGSAKGIITTPAIAFDAGYTYTLTFLAGAWDGTKEETTLSLSVSTGEISESSVTLAKGTWTSYTVTISNAEPNSTITFAANTTSNNRFFLDEVKVVSTTATTVPTEDADMIAGKTADGTEDEETVHYASYVTTYDVDMIYTEDVEAYIITGTEGSTLTMKKVRQIPAGTAVILKSKVNQTFTLCESPIAFANAEGDCEGNLLKAGDGSTTPAGKKRYVLSKGKTGDGKPGFYLLAADRQIPVGKAYLEVDETSAKAFYGFVYDEEATAIEVVDAAIEPTEQVIYTLAGQRVQTMTKGGIYIVNGKKVFVK